MSASSRRRDKHLHIQGPFFTYEISDALEMLSRMDLDSAIKKVSP